MSDPDPLPAPSVTGATPTARGAVAVTSRVPGPSEGLARCGDLEARRTGHASDRLILAARRLVRATDHDPDRLGCLGAGCVLAEGAGSSAGDELCRLAHALALLPLERAADPPLALGRPTDGGRDAVPALLAAFLEAISAAVEAVARCRRTAHAHGHCRFSAVAGQDGCAPILRAAHRYG